MITIPVSKPARAKAIVIGAGIATLLVARFLPAELTFVKELLGVLGVLSVGVGGAQIVTAPKAGGA